MSLWSRSSALAAKTPPTRNRYVDFLRAVSIGAVVFGHWLAAAPYVDERGELTPTHMLAVSPWTQGLTWVIQVMPVFFIVGGYANGISWRAARAAQRSYAQCSTGACAG
jgi:fucose 4-O-acetylase-like acetyltransferase